MCIKRKSNRRYTQTPRNKSGIADIESVLQLLRIKLWQIIARNNSEELTDPLVKPLKNSMPYVQKARADQVDDIASIKPTLDEVLPLPKKATETPAPPKQVVEPAEKLVPQKQEEASEEKSTTKKKTPKKTSAQDLVADDNEELPGQMTVDEAIAQAEGKGAQPQAVEPEQATEPKRPVEPEQATEPKRPAEPEQTSDHKQSSELEKLSLRDRYRTWKIDRADRNDYFDNLCVQVKNKNAACFELLDYLDELQEEL